jgi:hypothetical protein
VYRHRSVSLNNEKSCREISEDKIAVCEKIAGLQSWNFSDLNSPCSKVIKSCLYYKPWPSLAKVNVARLHYYTIFLRLAHFGLEFCY